MLMDEVKSVLKGFCAKIDLEIACKEVGLTSARFEAVLKQIYNTNLDRASLAYLGQLNMKFGRAIDFNFTPARQDDARFDVWRLMAMFKLNKVVPIETLVVGFIEGGFAVYYTEEQQVFYIPR